VRLLRLAPQSKVVAWNAIRAAARAPIIVFADADVRVAPAAIPLLIRRLQADPALAIAAGRELPLVTSADGLVARVAALPHRFDFGNVPGRLYALRTAALPEPMPETVLHEDAYLSVRLGRARFAKEPDAVVYLRPPTTWSEYLRQRIRNEVGKLQLVREFPDLHERHGFGTVESGQLLAGTPSGATAGLLYRGALDSAAVPLVGAASGGPRTAQAHVEEPAAVAAGLACAGGATLLGHPLPAAPAAALGTELEAGRPVALVSTVDGGGAVVLTGPGLAERTGGLGSDELDGAAVEAAAGLLRRGATATERVPAGGGNRIARVYDEKVNIFKAQDDNLEILDRWLAAVARDTAPGTQREKVLRNKPAGLADSCFTAKLEEIKDAARCAAMFPVYANPRVVAGAPATGDVFKCELKPIDKSDYKRPVTDAQLAQLRSVFPQGVCDYSKKGVMQRPASGVWLSFPPSPAATTR